MLELKEFAVILRPRRENFVATLTPAEAKVMDAHFAYFKRLLDEGKLKLAGRCEDGCLGLGILLCADADEARRLMAADPAINGGIFDHTLKPWRTALLSKDWREAITVGL